MVTAYHLNIKANEKEYSQNVPEQTFPADWSWYINRL